MAYNFVIKVAKLIADISGNSFPSHNHLFPAIRKNIGSQKLKDDREVESCDTITCDRDFNKYSAKKQSHYNIQGGSNMTGTICV
jgi:hypothetical protein